jgi:hypothetical protein
MLTEMASFCDFVVVQGRGAASGRHEYQKLGGSIRAQQPHFKRAGLDIGMFHNATLNLDVAPFKMVVKRPLFRIRNVRWLRGFPGEDFDFMNAAICFGDRMTPCMIYHPRPETKEAFTQPVPGNIVEILAPFIDGIGYGTYGQLHFDPRQVEMAGEAVVSRRATGR